MLDLSQPSHCPILIILCVYVVSESVGVYVYMWVIAIDVVSVCVFVWCVCVWSLRCMGVDEYCGGEVVLVCLCKVVCVDECGCVLVSE